MFANLESNPIRNVAYYRTSRRTDSGRSGTTGHKGLFRHSVFNRGVPSTVRESKELGSLGTVAPRQMAPAMSFPANLATRITSGRYTAVYLPDCFSTMESLFARYPHIHAPIAGVASRKSNTVLSTTPYYLWNCCAIVHRFFSIPKCSIYSLIIYR
ncbi:hypothetical protein B9Z19DRAFT_769517 [Tuber borchii]|uniref:Uncharacterized protein n=1 Tax=Tuber borchii TaxID=42251 RepID=A0A2T6ZX35_TUBBO|nr:hypothetical protein B9Z19DRAFT_769517 [Tuber borchii]